MPVDMRKQVTLGSEAREKLMEGIDILADAVVSTMGPNGRNVLIENNGAWPLSTKDGVTVAESIWVDGHIQDTGAQMVKQASVKTAKKSR